MKPSSSFFFWKCFYFLVTCFFTFFCCLDSWEYLYQEQTLSFQQSFSQIFFTVFQQQAYASITALAFYTSLYYLVPCVLTMILFSLSSSLFFEENLMLLLWFLFVSFSIQLSVTFANLYLPFYFEDMFYYQSHDPQMDFEFKWILDPHSFLKTKGFFICLFLCFIYLPPFCFSLFICFSLTSFWFRWIEQKTRIFVFFLCFNLFFFELRWFSAISLTCLFLCYCEILSFFFCLVSSYHLATFKRKDLELVLRGIPD